MHTCGQEEVAKVSLEREGMGLPQLPKGPVEVTLVTQGHAVPRGWVWRKAIIQREDV